MLTGAGISTESGIPDFRGPQGVWTKNPAAEKTATLQYYMSRSRGPARRRGRTGSTSEIWDAEPNAGHRALAELEQQAALHTLVTQNVDGLHHAAGQSPEIDRRDPRQRARGEVHAVRLAGPDGRDPRPGARRRGRPRVPRVRRDPEVGDDQLRREPRAPTTSTGRSEAAAGADVFLALGTSLGVYPAAALPEIALRNRRPAGDRQRRGDPVRRRRRRGEPRPARRACSRPWSARI